MCRLSLLVIAVLLLTSIVHSSEIRTWTDETGKFELQAKFSGTGDGKIKLTTKEGKGFKIAPDKLSDDDQEFLNKQLEAWKAMRASHTIWRVKIPQIKAGVATQQTMTLVLGQGIQNGSYQVPYTYKSYGFQPLQAMLVSYKGSDVTLRNNGGEGTFKYANFQSADQKFLDEYRLMDKEAGSLNEIDLPKSSFPNPNPNPNPNPSSYTPGGDSVVGQYDLGDGQTLTVGPNGTADSSQWGAGTWVYEEKGHRHHIHWAKHDVYVKPTSKGNLHVSDAHGHSSTAQRSGVPSGGSARPGGGGAMGHR